MSVSVAVESYDWDTKDEEILENATLNENSKITVCYDGGRLNVYVDGDTHRPIGRCFFP